MFRLVWVRLLTMPLAVLACLLTTGCGQRPSLQPPNGSDTGGAASQQTPTYLLQEHVGTQDPVGLVAEPGPTLSGTSPPDAALRRAMEQLLAYRRRAGLLDLLVSKRRPNPCTAVPPGTRLLDLSLRDGDVTVDLSGDASNAAAAEARLPALEGAGLRGRTRMAMMAQVVFTATGTWERGGVRVLVDGRPQSIWLPKRVPADGYLHRRDVQGLVIVTDVHGSVGPATPPPLATDGPPRPKH